MNQINKSNHTLSNIRIVDLGMYVAGPYASVPLAELGADVIKIEPLTGDPNRGIWRAFACTNRGKRSIAIDLKTPEGLQIAQKLCLSADVVHHNFRPGVADRIGLGYEELSKTKEDLIYLEASAYGDTGPMAKMPGFDMMLQAMCGHESNSAGDTNVPLWLRWAPVDFTGGYLGAIGILAGIYRKLKTGKGGLIKSNLLDGGLFMLSELFKDSDGQFKGVAQLNAAQTGAHPAQSLYQTKDSWLALVAISPEQINALAVLIDEQSSVETWGTEVQQKITNFIAPMSNDSAISLFRDNGLWCEACKQGVEQSLYNDSKWQEAGLVREHDYEQRGTVKMMGNMVRLSNISANKKTARVPQAGEDTREILASLNFNKTEIDELYNRKIVA